MAEKDHEYTRNLEAIFAELRERGCGAPPEVVHSHTVALAEIGTELKAVNKSLVKLTDKVEDHIETIWDNVRSQERDMVALKTEKRTAIAMLVSIGSALATAIGWALTFKGR